MSLQSMLDLIDDKLSTIFHTPAYNPEAARKPVIKGIEKTRAQFSEGRSKVPHKWWSVSNNVVEFAPKVGGSPLAINGKEKSFIPAERFPDFLDAFLAAVESGEFDETLKNHGQGEATVKVRKTRTPKEPRAAGEGNGWSEERKAKFAATIAARHAAKR